MILVAPDVWVAAGQPDNEDITHRLREILRTGDVLGHAMAFTSLMLRWSKAISDASVMLAKYEDLEQARVLDTDEIVALIGKHDLGGKDLTVVDANLLASAYTSKAKLWSMPGPLQRAAIALGIAYDPSSKEKL